MTLISNPKPMNTKLLSRVGLAVVIAVAAALFSSDISAKNPKPMKKVKLPQYKNEAFYKDGKFQVEKAKQAYFDMMASHGYPVTESLRTNMWATDFGLGD